MTVAIEGYGLERLWQNFFSGSTLFEDAHPEIEGIHGQGMEAGVDLFLYPEHREILKGGMIQVKSS